MGDWETTAQMFGSLFDKPKMTEKLLSKPPFKYLFDIVAQTTKVTGFAKGLYKDDELSADFYDTKEKKIYFLRKIIALSGAMLKEEIEAKPNKIVAGVEPEKTNLFLQAVYRAASCGEDSASYVKKINAKFAKEEAEMAGGAPQEDAKQEEPAREEPKKKPREEPKEEPKPKDREVKQKKPVEEPKKQEPAPTQTQTKPQRPGTASKRDKSNVEVVESNKKGPGPSGIIRDDDKNKDDDDKFFENQAQAQSKGLTSKDAEKHGQFVKQALQDIPQDEAPREDKPQQGGIKIKKKLGQKGATESKVERGVVETKDTTSSSGAVAGTSQNEVENIQKLIQNLTQNINPLRKSIDFINDDIESMNKEMEFWRNNFLGSKAKYQQEQANTEEQLQPLQNKLAELEEQIKDKKFKIQAAKSHILQNEQRIQKLLYSVVANK